MTNQEKYKTAQEREDAFRRFCKSNRVCEVCPLFEVRRAYNAYSFQYGCLLKWLEIEAEEGLPPCPFCVSEIDEYGKCPECSDEEEEG